MIPTFAPLTGTAGHRKLRQRALVSALLVLCLLVAQWVGLAHAVAHAHGLGNAGIDLVSAERSADTSPASPGLFDHPRASGACAALDAATLGAGPCADISVLPVQRAVQAPMPAVLLQRWYQPFVASFSTRAPPVDA